MLLQVAEVHSCILLYLVLMQKYLVAASAPAPLTLHPLLTSTFFDGRERKRSYTTTGKE